MKKIEIIAPASRISLNDVNKTKAFLKENSFDINFSGFKKDLICSAPVLKRTNDLKKALKNKKSDFIWCLRGGYGSHQILDHLKKTDFKTQKKILMGFSDITSLHYYFNQVIRWPSIHGPHPNSFIRTYSKRVLKETLSFIENPLSQKQVFSGLNIENRSKVKTFTAKIIGGNLTTLVSVIGTKYDRGAKERILFLEEIAEPAYKVNRMMVHMEQSGFLKGVKAVVFGSFTHHNNKEALKIKKYLKEWAKLQKFMVLSGMKAGHIKENRPFLLGVRSKITLDQPLDQKASLHNNI